jgi:hypothetical protein
MKNDKCTHTDASNSIPHRYSILVGHYNIFMRSDAGAENLGPISEGVVILRHKLDHYGSLQLT